MLQTFSCCDPTTKTELFRSFCLSLYGCVLWSSSSSELRSLEVTVNNILWKIWSLSRYCHTAILHLVACMHSLYNTVITRSHTLISVAVVSGSAVVADVFSESRNLVYTTTGYNNLYGHIH